MYCKNLLLNKNKSGQTLVELMVAVGLIAMVVTALLVLVSAATKVGVSSLRRSQAAKIATLALESVRYYRDKDTYEKIPSGDVCFTIENEINPGATPLTSISCSDPNSFQLVSVGGTQYTRQIRLTAEDDVTNSRDIIVQVRWIESGGTPSADGNYRQVILSSSIARW